MAKKPLCEKRNYTRSIRISAKTREYVEQHEGKSFNDKLERIIEISKDRYIPSHLDIEKAYLEQLQTIKRYEKIEEAVSKIRLILADIKDDMDMLHTEEKWVTKK